MPEQLKNIYSKALEYWNKWTTKQKTIIISSFAGVIAAIALIVFILGRTHYTELYTFENTETASLAVQSLKNSSIVSKLASDGRTVMVDENMYVEAVANVYSSDLGGEEFTVSQLLDNSLTTTNGERLLKSFLRSESKMRAAILGIQGVTDVVINYIGKDTSNSILAQNQSVPASVVLTINNKFDKKQAEGIAQIVAAGLGNKNTDDITVINQIGEVLFDGKAIETDDLDYTDKLVIQRQMKEEYIEYVKGALIMNGYTDIDVVPNLKINFDKATQMFEEHLPLEGEDRGVLYHLIQSSSESTGGTADVPGTDSNDEVDYYIQNGGTGNSESTSMEGFYEPSIRITNTVYDTGTVTDASISVTAVKIITRTKSQLERMGLLAETSYEQYVIDNIALTEKNDKTKTRTDDDLYTLVSLATGIDEDKVVIITYEVYDFINDTSMDLDPTMVVQISMAVVLLAFLMFIIIKGMKPVEITEVEPELSIEQLLATTKENQGLEDVEFNEESETRRMIEKFFDENPEAVASLLRNWLNEDWM